MEAAGLAVGIAALFSTCVDSFKIVFAAQNFARDFEVLSIAFEQQRLRFLLWGERMGLPNSSRTTTRLYAEGLERPDVRPTILRSLAAIQQLLREFKVYETRYGLKHDPLLSSLDLESGAMATRDRLRAITRRNQREKSINTVTKWAIFDAEKLKSTVDSLRDLIDGLISISDQTTGAEPDRVHGEPCLHAIEAEPLQEAGVQMSRQIEALDLQSSVETFFTAKSNLSLETDDLNSTQPADMTTLQEVATRLYIAVQSPANSVDTYSSSSDSGKSILRSVFGQEALQDLRLRDDIYQSSRQEDPWTAIPQEGLPRTFSEYFPSTHKIYVKHDESTIDGNMNLQLFVSSVQRGPKIREAEYIILFHLRMQDLAKREFSLRRHCRDSGREVCHSFTGQETSNTWFDTTRSTLHLFPDADSAVSDELDPATDDQRKPRSARGSFSSWFKRRNFRSSQASVLAAESGDELDDQDVAIDTRAISATRASNKTIILEFPNYAHICLVRSGHRTRKRYRFVHWDTKYVWKRESTVSQGNVVAASCSEHCFRLFYDEGKKRKEILAQITPAKRDEQYDVQTDDVGTWVPRSEFRILHRDIIESNHDIADVVVATGIVALVDNAIRATFHTPPHVLELQAGKVRAGNESLDAESEPLTPL